VGVPDQRFGEKVVAVVSLRPGETAGEDELVAHVRSHVSGYKVPRSWVFVDHCERLPTGKPDYQWAKELARSAV
jgi:3-oxocholest-4-en-26-oate---CoA ligase